MTDSEKREEMQTPLEILKFYYGYNSFRPQQEAIINAVLQRRDCLVLMPTGGGKSVCYQVPAMLMEGVTVVVSPLISLMKDQVEGLRMNGVPAYALNSGNTAEENRVAMDACMSGEAKLLYVSPERLVYDLERLAMLRVSMIAIDEAHCISQWGHDFRQEYTMLWQLRNYFPYAPIMALTATADKITKMDIVRQLRLYNPQIFISSFDRPNLSLEVKAGCNKREKINEIVDVVRRHNGESGIIYCLSRKNTEIVAKALRENGIDAEYYHAGMETQERNAVQEDFIKDRTQVICATVAFGMGIDKSNVRYVIHYNMPKSIEEFYQEIGRAGRDGLPSETILFYNISDIMTLEEFARESGQKSINLDKLQRMREYAEARVCRRRILLNYFGEESECRCGNCDICENPPKLLDGTTIVQKALCAILRTGEQVGAQMVVDILRGADTVEVRRRSFDAIKTFGAGKDVSAHDWQNYLLQMLQMGFVEIAYDEGKRLKVTGLGMEVIGGKNVTLVAVEMGGRRRERRDRKWRGERRGVERMTRGIMDEDLYEALRTVRKTIADEMQVPAFIVFSDKTLSEIATEKPTTRVGFAEIYGVGKRKAEMFAERFIEVVRRFV